MFYKTNLFDDMFTSAGMLYDCLRSISERGAFEEPEVSLYEDGDCITVKALMPGVAAEDLNVELAGKELIIEGEKKNDDGDRHYLLRERSFGKFKKSVFLPFDAEVEKVKAVLAEGVFTVTLEKSENAKSRKIEIH